MLAVVCSSGQLILQQDYPPPIPQPDEALVRVTLAGICATDLEIVKGYVPDFSGVLGHEFVGVVEQSADSAWVGQRVVASINVGCETCDVCRQSGPEHCPNRRVLGIHDRDGVFAECVAVPLRNLHRVPDTLPDERVIFAEPLAAAIRIREQLAIRPSAKTAVIGPGRLGLLVAQVLHLAGEDITLLGRQLESLALPASWGIATGLTTDYAESSFDFVVEVTGNENGFAEALRLVRPLGNLVLKSTFAGDSQVDLTKIVVGEITVTGSRCGPFAPALRLLAADTLHTAPLITAAYPLHQAKIAFDRAAQPGVLKVLLRP